MLNIQKLRNTPHQIVAIGTHIGILQSILDFDFMAGKKSPSVVAIIGSGRRFERFFWGRADKLIPVYPTVEDMGAELQDQCTGFINLTSGRRTLLSTLEMFKALPGLKIGTLFAENVPEMHATQLIKAAQKHQIPLIGPASVGLMIPGILKLGAIGGVAPDQLTDSRVFEAGNTALLCSSGGMINELIRLLATGNIGLSFALSFGGDRFPVLTPREAFISAEQDKETKYIVYFGELGGYDEYEIVKLMEEKQITKPVIAYIAGSIATVFASSPQFGHAKALAQKKEETAHAKAEALRKAGAHVGNSFAEFVNYVHSIIPASMIDASNKQERADLSDRKHALFTSTVSGDLNGVPTVLGQELTELATSQSVGSLVIAMLLGKKSVSAELGEFTELVFKLLVDHGPYVSGAVNTIITARAGRDLVSSLCAGLLTIGPRFGGAINEAALNWLTAVNSGITPSEFVETYAKQKKYISGIGHRKYNTRTPDPRVSVIAEFASHLTHQKHMSFARKVEAITTAKKANLILNVDGAIAAVMLDLLTEKEHMTTAELHELVSIEFFNALFILSRSVGFSAHYLDQRRLDEGLFRLPHELVADNN